MKTAHAPHGATPTPTSADPVAKPVPGSEAASQATIALLQAHSLSSAVQAEIERLILSGELAPGAKLTEALLAERLGVSRGPIREAFRVLEEAGLVRQEKNRGAFVRSIPLDEAREIFDLRVILEEAAVRHLAEHITPEQLRALRTMVEQMERLVRDGHNTSASDQYHLLNLAFHEALVDSVGNRKLATLYRRLVKELSLLRRANLAGGRQIPVSASEHRAVLKAIAAGDADAAGQALRAHVIESKERTLKNQGGPTPGSAGAAGAATRKIRHA
ncbi:MAG: phosphonate utilization associated transcriptional regulator [Piscinibacter sp.]|nr:phosphonate utilization associated transcriptional regulator [Piscinibacter sp.]